MAMSDRLAVMALIGAGPVGLGLAKVLLEHKIPYEQLEADREVGGNWLHGVYETVHIISSRKTTEYTDYPMPADYPDFPSRQQMLDYLRDYAQKFQLAPHIQFNTKVVMALPLADGRWELELASGEKRVYKGLIVCNGDHWDRRFPNYPGKFEGEFMHSKDYRARAQLAGKRELRRRPVILGVHEFAFKFSRIVRKTPVPVIPVANNQPFVDTLLAAGQFQFPTSIRKRQSHHHFGVELNMRCKLEFLGIVPQIIEHLLAAGKIRIVCRHGIVGVFRGLARRDYVHCLIDAVQPVPSDLAVRFQLFVRNLVLEQSLSQSEPHRPCPNQCHHG